MTRWLGFGLLVSAALFCAVVPADAGPKEDAVAAYGRGDFAAVLRFMRPLAEKGDATAQNSLGHLYLHGRGVPKNDVEAARWYSRAAAQGDSEARYNLAFMHYYGRGVPQSPAEALRLFRGLADEGDVEATYRAGQMLYHGEGVASDIGAARALFLRLAKWAESPEGIAARPEPSAPVLTVGAALRLLGDMYANGEGVAEDDTQAIAWYRKAAAWDDAGAQYLLGQRYVEGDGVPPNLGIAATWFRQAAERGHPIAQFLLAAMLKSGEGVPTDLVEAYVWFDLAVPQLSQQAKTMAAESRAERDDIAGKLTPAQITEAQRRAQDFKPK